MKEKLALLAGALIFVLTAMAVCLWDASAFDDAIRYPFYELRDSCLAPAILAVSKFLHYFVSRDLIIPACIVLLIIPKTRIQYGIPISAAALVETLVFRLIKTTIARPRPEDVLHLVSQAGWSFPSGHSTTSMCLCALIIWLLVRCCQNKALRRTLITFFAAVAVLTGPSRIFLGVHYPTDVLGGWALGIAIAAATVLVISRFRPWQSEDSAHSKRTAIDFSSGC